MDRALPQKFPFILDWNLAKINCTEDRVCTSCDTVVLAFALLPFQLLPPWAFSPLIFLQPTHRIVILLFYDKRVVRNVRLPLSCRPISPLFPLLRGQTVRYCISLPCRTCRGVSPIGCPLKVYYFIFAIISDSMHPKWFNKSFL